MSSATTATEDPKVTARLDQIAAEVHALLTKQTPILVLKVGKLLAEARDMHARPGCKGTWTAWFRKQDFPMRQRKAEMLSDAYRLFVNVQANSARLAGFGITAVYQFGEAMKPEDLGTGSPEDKALEEALELAKQGERVTARVAHDLIEKHRTEAAKAEALDKLEASRNGKGDPAKPTGVTAPGSATTEPDLDEDEEEQDDPAEIEARKAEMRASRTGRMPQPETPDPAVISTLHGKVTVERKDGATSVRDVLLEALHEIGADVRAYTTMFATLDALLGKSPMERAEIIEYLQEMDGQN